MKSNLFTCDFTRYLYNYIVYIIHVRLKNIEEKFCEKARHMKIRMVFCTTHSLGKYGSWDINRISVNVPKDLFDLAKEV